MTEVEDPCMRVCQHDSQGVCFGCRRNHEEVGNWSGYSNEEKEKIIRITRKRRNVAGEEPTGFLR